ncbi:MAG: deoxyribodipyrimidine photo-lyase, partial [Planctomycetales bacterium]|nr:deoxyribodipyrimidine photo-lyase [Planctomycetales bacterium]
MNRSLALRFMVCTIRRRLERRLTAKQGPAGDLMAQSTNKIQKERITLLNDEKSRAGDYVLYWMQQSQRAECNHALEYAVQRANHLDKPLLVAFGLMDDYPEANERHYRFMLEGLQQTQRQLEQRGIAFTLRHGAPVDVVCELACDACMVVCDRGYLRHQRAWRTDLAKRVECEVVEVEADAVAPVETTSQKREYAARTIRPKITRLLDRFLIDLRTTPLERDALSLKPGGLDLGDLDGVVAGLKIDRSVPAVSWRFRGGAPAARAALKEFVDNRLKHYQEHRARAETDDISHMSIYLHFGQISPLYVALQIRGARRGSAEDRDSYLEELLVRRELSLNFVWFERHYDAYTCLPDWAKKT